MSQPVRDTASVPTSSDLLLSLSGARVIVLGDIILDRYMHGSADRMSPEAPVPVVTLRHESSIPGGAANVAINITTMGAHCTLLGMVGQDRYAEELHSLLGAHSKLDARLVPSGDRPTITKTRIVAQGQQMLRLDRENTAPAPPAVEDLLLQHLGETLPGAGALILSDYGKGTLPNRVLTGAFRLARELGVPTFVDPKGRDYQKYRGCTCLTPNAREASEATGTPVNTPEGLLLAAERLRDTTDAPAIVITRGADGLALFQKDLEPLLLPTVARDVFDVTGAGDTFIGFLALGTAAGLALPAAAALANRAAGIVVSKVGAAAVLPAELEAALESERLPAASGSGDKLVTLSELAALVAQIRSRGQRIALANGCFDFLHAGTLALLDQARNLADVLIVATNDDAGIFRLKGPGRPVLAQGDRIRRLAALSAVDRIVVYEEDTPHRVLETVRPDLLVKGAVLRPDQVEGREFVESYGGRVVLLTTPAD
jgi:D-beta-D-heptose 7-phosphate kinase/D-beta-D-heptose 1-phosphate adenosyltransferase